MHYNHGTVTKEEKKVFYINKACLESAWDMLYCPWQTYETSLTLTLTLTQHPGVVSTDSTLIGYWYLKDEVKYEYVESNGYVIDCEW